MPYRHKVLYNHGPYESKVLLELTQGRRVLGLGKTMTNRIHGAPARTEPNSTTAVI